MDAKHHLAIIIAPGHVEGMSHEGAKQSKTSPKVVYMGPDKGPFRCGRCEYFEKPSSCEKVSGVIDDYGCCNLFEPK